MLMNIISHTRPPYFPYTLYRGQAIGGVNKEAVCRRPHEGTPRVLVKPTKVSEPPDDVLERINQECL